MKGATDPTRNESLVRILLWSDSSELVQRITPNLTAAGHVLFKEPNIDQIVDAARQEQPLTIVLAPTMPNSSITAALHELSDHPETRWIPTILVAQSGSNPSFLQDLLEAGAAALVNIEQDSTLFQAQLKAFERTALQVATLRSARFTDEETGYYHKTFLLDQLQVFCRKFRRDGLVFSLVFVEIRGTQYAIQKVAVQLAATVRGADLFGFWENGLFAVLLPGSGEDQACLLARRFQQILEQEGLEARGALAVAQAGLSESEALVETALNTLDAAWQSEASFLWICKDGVSQSFAQPSTT